MATAQKKPTATVSKIEKLTPAQAAKIPAFRDEWLSHGLSTKPADRPRAEAGVRLAYEAAGLAPPTTFIWLDSPHAGAIGAFLLTQGSSKIFGAQVRAQVWDQVRAQVRDQVWYQVRAQVRDQVRAQVGAQVRAQVGDQVGAQVNRAGYGQHDSEWVAFYEFFGRACGVKGVDRLRGIAEIAQSCGWWWPFERAVILTDRPSEIHRDEANRLHAEKGPALLYRDGWGVHAWHGVRIPAEWLEGKTPSPAEALNWPNMEQRRAACEIIGWARILRELKAKTINKDRDPEVGELVEVEIPEIGKERFIRVRCGTGREFAIPVPPNMRTALEANAWTWGLEPKEYTPEVRT